jgi:hypothetical protein
MGGSYSTIGGKRLLGRPRHRCVDHISMDLGEVGWGDIEPSGSMKCWETIQWPLE